MGVDLDLLVRVLPVSCRVHYANSSSSQVVLPRLHTPRRQILRRSRILASPRQNPRHLRLLSLRNPHNIRRPRRREDWVQILP